MRTIEVRPLGIGLILVILAVICFALATMSAPSLGRINWMALGLFFWALSSIIP
jgi:hypothetical protein